MIMLGKTLTGRYKIVKQLGGGGFSQTFIAEDGYLPDRPTCVIKQLKPASSQAEILKISRELFDKEAKVLYKLGRHECIPSLLAHFEEDEEFFLAQELIEGDVLTQEIKRGQCLGEQYTIDFLTDILPTLDFVHHQQVIHRDIKPSNLIRRASDKKIVLIDFGAVKEVSTQPISQLGHTSSLVIGSPGYMPNEQYSGKTMFASDIYAIGVIAIQALTGVLPNQIPEDPITSEFCWRDRAKVTPTLADVIDKMVRFDFRQRYQSANDVLEALQPLLMQSEAQTVFSEFAPSPLTDLSLVLNPPEKTNQSYLEKLIDEVSDDLEMSEDPVRAKKLVCLVCTGILENDLNRLNNFSFVELLEDLYQQFPSIEALKENLVKSVKTIAVQKQRQYLIVAKIVFNAASKLYPQTPVSVIAEPISSSQVKPNPQTVSQPLAYSVNHLVINAGSAQLIAPIDTSQNNCIKEPLNNSLIATPPSEYQFSFTEDELSLIDPYLNDDSDIYAWVAHNIDTDAQQMRLKKLLFYTYQDVWESDLRQLNSIDWASLLRELVSFMPTFQQLTALLHESVQRVSKPTEYAVIGNLLLSKLEPLYPDRSYENNLSEVSPAIAPPIAPTINQPDYYNRQSRSKIPFDPQIAVDLFDLRLELMRFTSSMRAKILLFSVLYYPFDSDRDNWHDLRTHGLDGLLRQLFYAYSFYEKAEKAIWQTARSLSEPSAYDQSASYILQAIKTLYDQIEAKSMLHPAEGNLSQSDDTDFTQPSLLFRSSDDDTCQFI
ncbi:MULTISPECIES: serine/threonine-protein kinase [Pseudanabaena]|uniref:serine/threonine-protein kinase n=1 Tax=Pseudanabaena TaxID=1152 RepID=UPI00247A4293|nr:MULTISPECIES: serine/threonine-protein kinase [Pseudanabaena]MEA5487389.1 serine/threonine-protein kinase [Pseudanabaena sp. CCNP1317]WGS74575.1 serine/threonine-protein kinase [Pseudanabaena galeata CCNP1313]